MNTQNIITVGLTPVWDRTCYVEGIDWGDHKVIASHALMPAGKALNISKALAWMSVPSAAAGLWGAADYADMTEALSVFGDYIEPAHTVVPGNTRHNITVVDTRGNREMHLRSAETLISQEALRRLGEDLGRLIKPQSHVVFSGAMPEGALQDECLRLAAKAGGPCAERIVDTSGSALVKIVNQGGLDVIKPNLEELGCLLGKPIDADIASVVKAAAQLCDRVRVVLVSLGRQGAAVITGDIRIHCKIKKELGRTVHTVGCGDCLVAGFLWAAQADISRRLAAGVQAATAKAWGWAGRKTWAEVQKEIEVDITAC